MFAPSIKTTTSVCNGALRGALANAGFEVVENGGFLEASDGKQALAILPVSRCLSSRNHTETTPSLHLLPVSRNLWNATAFGTLQRSWISVTAMISTSLSVTLMSPALFVLLLASANTHTPILNL